MFWFIGIIILLALSGFVAFKEGEVHELHKTRAMFEKFEHAHPLVKDLLELEEGFKDLENELKDFDVFGK